MAFKWIMAIEFVWIHPRLWVIKRYIVFCIPKLFIDGKFKFLGILGFPTHQNFDCTTYDEICKAFLRRSKKVMIKRELGGFQLEFVSISRVISHMTCYKFKCSHWWKINLKRKSFTRFALQSDCCNFNQ